MACENNQQLQIEDYEFQKLCYLNEDLLKGELKMRKNQPQFDKKRGMEHVLKQCHKVREISIGLNRRLYVTFLQYIKDNPASTYVQIRLFWSKREQRVQTTDLCQLHSEWVQGVVTKIEGLF